MKKHILNLILCLVLVLSLSVSAAAENLNTANISVDKDNGTVIIGEAEDAALASLHDQGKTARIAIPYAYGAGDYYVMKDSCVIITTAAEKLDGGLMRFPVPGAGRYEIKLGPAPTLEEQLDNLPANGQLSSLPVDVLKEDREVSGNLVITASGAIKGDGGTKTLTVVDDGTLTVQNINGGVEVALGAGDAISFDTNGKASIAVAENVNEAGKPLGYGSFRITTVNQEGNEITQNFFVAEGEEFSVLPDGTIKYEGDFGAAEKEDGDLPPYRVTFDKQDNDHVLGDSTEMISECNGLYDHYTTIELELQGAEAKRLILATKVGDKDVVAAAGITVAPGSTILTLESSYLNTLPAGKHRLYFHYDDGGDKYADLWIKQAAATGTTTQATAYAATAQADPTNPKTGDPIMGILLTLLGSTAGLTGVCAGKRKVR